MCNFENRISHLVSGPYTRVLAEHEAAIAQFYNCLGSIFPRHSRFWRGLAAEEIRHRNIVLALDERIKNGHLKFERPKFLYSTVIDAVTWINSVRRHWEDSGVSMRQALETSLCLERGMLEAKFFEIVRHDRPEASKMLEELIADTEQHILCVETECKRLKWRVVGTKVVQAPETKTPDPGEAYDAKGIARATQANVLEMLICLEEAAGCLYRTYSHRLADSSDFWQDRADEEMQHADMLRSLHKFLERGDLFYNMGHFKRPAIEAAINSIIDTTVAAEKEPLTLHKAVNTALSTENLFLEKGFYSTAESTAPEFATIAKRLVQLSKDHIEEITEQAGRALDIGDKALEEVPPQAAAD